MILNFAHLAPQHVIVFDEFFSFVLLRGPTLEFFMNVALEALTGELSPWGRCHTGQEKSTWIRQVVLFCRRRTALILMCLLTLIVLSFLFEELFGWESDMLSEQGVVDLEEFGLAVSVRPTVVLVGVVARHGASKTVYARVSWVEFSPAANVLEQVLKEEDAVIHVASLAKEQGTSLRIARLLPRNERKVSVKSTNLPF